jgi:hypothetical protein
MGAPFGSGQSRYAASGSPTQSNAAEDSADICRSARLFVLVILPAVVPAKYSSGQQIYEVHGTASGAPYPHVAIVILGHLFCRNPALNILVRLGTAEHEKMANVMKM